MLDADKFAPISVKIGRAKKHFSDLQSEILGWRRSKPYVIRTKRDPQTRQLIYYVHSAKSLPLEIPAIIGDVLGNLRSALDYIVYQLFEIRHPTTPPRQRFGFPVCDSAKGYEATVSGIVKNLGQDVADLIGAVKPYKRLDELFPNGAIWCLHSLNNVSKHRLLLTVCTQYQMHGVTPRIIQELSSQFPGEKTIDFISSISVDEVLRKIPVKEGYELYRAPPDCEVEKDLTFDLDVSFNELTIMEVWPVLPALQHFTDLVEGISRKFRPLFS
jgi:hypothetical protein